MRKTGIFSILLIWITFLAAPSLVFSQENKNGGVPGAVQKVEKKVEKAVRNVEAAGAKAVENIETKTRETQAKINASIKYGHEKARQRAEWLRKKAEKLEKDAERIEARIEADVRRELDRIERKTLKAKKKIEGGEKTPAEEKPKDKN